MKTKKTAAGREKWLRVERNSYYKVSHFLCAYDILSLMEYIVRTFELRKKIRVIFPRYS